MWAVVPVKASSSAKSRLASSLDAPTRRELQRALLVQTLDAIRGCRRIERSLVVSRDTDVLRLAERCGALSLVEPASSRPGAEGPLNAALDAAAQYALEQGARSLLVLPGDLPRLDAKTLDALTAELPPSPRAVAVVSDRHGDGTNALFCRPPHLLPFAFGKGSAREHLRRARAAHAEAVGLTHANLELDLDTPEDLALLRRDGALPEILDDVLQSAPNDSLPTDGSSPRRAHAPDSHSTWRFT